MEKSELHNQVTKDTLQAMFRPLINSGATGVEVMIVIESVVAGAFIMAVNMGGDNIVLDVLFDRVRERLAEERLGNLQPKGNG